MVHVLAYSASGKSTWSDVVLLGGGVLVAFGLIFGFVWLLGAPGRKRYRERREAVAKATAADPEYSVAAITTGAQGLFTRALEASTDGRLTELGAHAMKTGPIARGPEVDVIGLALNGDDRHASVRVRARIGTKNRYVTYDRYWTVTNGADGWAITKIFTAEEARRTVLREPAVT